MNPLDVINALELRIEALEADVGSLSEIKRRRHDAAKQDATMRLSRIARLEDTSARNAAIAALTHVERLAVFQPGMGDNLKIVREAGEHAARWMQYCSPAEQDQIEADLVEIPRMAFIVPSTPDRSFSRSAVDITTDQADALARVGLGGRISRQSRLAFIPFSFTPSAFREVVSVEGLALMLRVDKLFADAVRSGWMLTKEFSDEENRAHLLDEWARTPRHQRRALPRKVVAS